MESVLLDAAGHRRSPATMPGYHRGRSPRNKGEEYPADPPTVEEIVAVMRAVGDRADGQRLRALIVLLWRAGLRISEALALHESDLDPGRGAVLVRRGKGGKRREVGMDRWAWDQLDPWLEIRREFPAGALLCVIHGPTAGRRWEASAARTQLHHAAAEAAVRRRFAPHQLRHAHAVEMAHEGVPLLGVAGPARRHTSAWRRAGRAFSSTPHPLCCVETVSGPSWRWRPRCRPSARELVVSLGAARRVASRDTSAERIHEWR
jgi:integrase